MRLMGPNHTLSESCSSVALASVVSWVTGVEMGGSEPVDSREE